MLNRSSRGRKADPLRAAVFVTAFLLALSATPYSAFAASVTTPQTVSPFAATSTTPRGAPLNALQTLTDPNPMAGGEYGISVAVNGTLAVVGAQDENVSGMTDAGRAYVFNASTGALLFTLTSPNAQAGGSFGFSVAVDGSYIAVGAPEETASGESGAGNVYVYSASTDALLYTLDSPNPMSFGNFGWSVSLGGSYLAVGAYRESISGAQLAGRAYIFEASTGKLLSKLASPLSEAGGRFGWTVSASSNYVVVGAYHEVAEGLGSSGDAYIYDASTGALTYTLQSPNPQADGYFGYSVAVNGQSVIVGAIDENASQTLGGGEAYVFSASTGKLLFSLISPNAQADVGFAIGQFGRSVALSGTYFVVGAPTESASGDASAGNAYVFSASTGKLLYTLSSPKAMASGVFGWSVALSGNYVVAGAWAETGAGQTNAGAAYSFSTSSGSTPTSTTPTTTTIASSTVPEFNGGALLVALLASMALVAIAARRRSVEERRRPRR